MRIDGSGFRKRVINHSLMTRILILAPLLRTDRRALPPLAAQFADLVDHFELQLEIELGEQPNEQEMEEVEIWEQSKEQEQ